MRRRFAFAVSLILITVSARAQRDAIVADRPGLADGSSTVGAGVAQLEMGVTVEMLQQSRIALPTLLRFGITDSLELRVESDVVGISSGSNDLAPIAAGFKLRLRGGELPLSVLASVQPPSGGGALRAADFESELRLVSDIEIGGGVSLTPNVGLTVSEGGTSSAVVAASAERSLGQAVSFVDFEATTGAGDTSIIADAGVAWILTLDTQLDVSGGFNLMGQEYPDWFVAAGISRRF